MKNNPFQGQRSTLEEREYKRVIPLVLRVNDREGLSEPGQ